MTTRVSIVTPSFQQAAYLRQTMLSVLEQDYPAIEYIVVDGGSTDGSVDIIREYEHRLAGWESGKDRGQADAINKGMARATGDVLAWINSDDYYLPGAVSAAVRALEAEPDLGMVYADVLSVDGSGRQFNHMHFEDRGLDGLMRFQIIGQPSVFFRRRIYEQTGGLDETFHYLLDHKLWLEIARRSPIRHIQQTWSAARFHAGAKNVAAAAGFGEEAYRLVEWMQAQPDLCERFSAQKKQIEAGAHRFNARYLSVGGQPGKALAAYRQAFASHAPTAFKDWKRILVTLLALAGIDIDRRYM